MVDKTFCYIEYAFQVHIEPSTATEKKVEFVIDDNLSLVHYSANMDAAARGLFRIDEMNETDFYVLGFTDYKFKINCRATDGGTASDSIWFKIDYSKRTRR